MEKQKTQKPVRAKKTEIVQSQERQVDTFISEAIAKNLPVETMEKLFELRSKVKAEQAREAFVDAMAQFQSKCPQIPKTKIVKNKDGTVRYKYAPLDVITDTIKDHLAENGLAYTWNSENDKEAKELVAICKVTHKYGHSETSEFRIPITPSQFMTGPQTYASALTYAKRYTLCNALGISTAEEDTDATDVNEQKDAKSVKSKIMFLLKRLNADVSTKETIEASVKTATQLDLKEENFDEIVERLSILVKENEEYDNSEV